MQSRNFFEKNLKKVLTKIILAYIIILIFALMIISIFKRGDFYVKNKRNCK